ncbi:MAG: hypothetical protein ACTSXJ_05335 [Candidatus Baldrarchaeia archaeon]
MRVSTEIPEDLAYDLISSLLRLFILEFERVLEAWDGNVMVFKEFEKRMLTLMLSESLEEIVERAFEYSNSEYISLIDKKSESVIYEKSAKRLKISRENFSQS